MHPSIIIPMLNVCNPPVPMLLTRRIKNNIITPAMIYPIEFLIWKNKYSKISCAYKIQLVKQETS